MEIDGSKQCAGNSSTVLNLRDEVKFRYTTCRHYTGSI